MRRFLAGLALGPIAAAVTYGATGSGYWLWLAWSVAAVGVWTWPLTRDELTDH